MSPWPSLLSPERLADLAIPSNRRLGEAIAAEGAVELLAADDRRVEARVGGTGASGQRRRVSLSLTPQGLAWTCSCSRSGAFCKHCVAVAARLTRDEA